jgi:hypothetical protein
MVNSTVTSSAAMSMAAYELNKLPSIKIDSECVKVEAPDLVKCEPSNHLSLGNARLELKTVVSVSANGDKEVILAFYVYMSCVLYSSVASLSE